jgi:hypothetical protein
MVHGNFSQDAPFVLSLFYRVIGPNAKEEQYGCDGQDLIRSPPKNLPLATAKNGLGTRSGHLFLGVIAAYTTF